MLAILLLSYVLAALSQPELLVKLDKGNIQGHYNYLGMKEWMGIPYARPPVGDLRWTYPQEPDNFKDTYVANYLAPACAQHCKLPPGNCPDLSGYSEDCLYVTVWGPKEAPRDPAGYPVFVWIHGGAYEQGMGNCALYNGTNFAEKGVMTVVINYRLGAFGFLASESMTGNYGHMDQRLAMQWVKKNIAAFGGNPNKITAGGQSAGGMSIGAHLVSPGSKGLFNQAIMESNPLALPFHERSDATQNANDVFAYVNCTNDDLACMRTKSVEEILDAQDHAVKLNFNNLFINFLPFAPLVDPAGEIPVQPFYGLMRGEFTELPVLAGTVLDEGQLFVQELFTKPVSEAAYKGIVSATFGVRNTPQILAMYPFDLVPGSTDGRDVFNVLATDLLFYCPLRNATRGYQNVFGGATQPTYSYRFEHVLSFDAWGPGYEFCVGSVCHGSELCFVFDVYTDGVSVDYTPSADEVALTTDLSNAWTNFIARGNPNTGLPIKKVYPQYNEKEDSIIVLNEPETSLDTHAREKFCQMWDKMGYFW